MGNPKDATGLRFGRLTAVERAGTSANGSSLWRCVCDCGKEKVASYSHLAGGFVQSCGCLNKEARSRNCTSRTKHGGRSRKDTKANRLYSVWNNMRDRCNNPKSKPFPNYGGRGITVCPEWNASFEAFRDWAMAAGYDPTAPYGQLTLDRIDCNKGYSPDNCRWVDMKTQADNRRSGRDGNGRYTPAQAERK